MFCTFLPSGSILNPMNAPNSNAPNARRSLLPIAAATFVTTLFLPPSLRWAQSYCRSGDGWRAGGLACRGGAVSPHSHSVYFTIAADCISVIKRPNGEKSGQFVQEKFLMLLCR